VLDFMGTEEAQLELYEAGNRPPALVSAFEQVAGRPGRRGLRRRR
jgi:arabinogalactan oligomer / maltooligosaccharide transport system substrate-binding protein